jgi:putative membrane-bound dehydrogenase-like protein
MRRLPSPPTILDRSISLFRTLTTVIACTAASRLAAQLDPEPALAAMTPAEGLAVELFAAEPDVVNPTAIDIDPQGRVWVCEGVNYRGRANPPFRKTGDRIVVLEDTDGDGRADRSRVFYEGTDLEVPLGICHLGDRLFIAQSPAIFTIEIRPDGTAGAKQDFLTGFGGRNHDHGVHSFVLGPDGLLYGAFGNEGAQLTDRTGKKIASDGKPFFGGMVFRSRLDGTGLEALAHNFRNNYECALDSFGNIWQSDNDDDGNQWVRFVYVMEGGNYGFLGPTGRHWSQEQKSHWHMEDPGVVPTLLRTGAGSPTGLCVYEGELLPERYRGKPLHADAGPRVIQCFPVRPHGAGFHVEGAPLDGNGRQTIETLSRIVKPEVLLTSSDSFFRPSDVAVAPDGSLLVADWYDPGVGGHGMGDTSRGRIYRLVPKGHRGYRTPSFDLSSAEGLKAELASPALSRRSLAVLALIAKGNEALALLEEVAASRNPIPRARALWLLARLDGGRQRVEAALTDPDPAFRVLALRALARARPAGILEVAKRLAADADPQVRREVLVALRDVPGPEATGLIVQLAGRHDGQDRWYLEAVGIASRGREGAVFQGLAASWGEAWPPAATSLIWELRAPEAASLLGDRAARAELSEGARQEAIRALAQLESREAGGSLVKVLSSSAPPAVKAEAAAAVTGRLGSSWSHLREGKELEAAAAAILDTPGLEEAALGLIAAGRLTAFRERAEALAAKEGGLRRPAIGALAALDDRASLPLLARLARETEDGEAAAALGRMSGAEPQEALRAILLDAPLPGARSAAVKALGGSRSGAVLLLHLAKAGDLPDAAKALATTVVHSSAYEDVRLMAGKILPRPKEGGGQELPPVAELAKREGDARLGRSVFFDEGKGNCARCHRLRKRGSDVGPDLSAIGTKLGREGLLEAILSPSAAIAHEYKVWILQTRSAGFVNGYLVDESPQQVTIKDANGKAISFARDDVIDRTPSDISLMPEGLTGSMTAGDLVDLVTFLERERTVAGGRRVLVRDYLWVGPFPNGDEQGYDAEYPPEKGIDLAREEKGRDGSVSWKRLQAREDGYVDLTRLIEHTDQCVAYCFTAVESPQDQEVELAIGSDDGVKVWVNGDLVHRSHQHRAAEPDQERVRAHLRKGRNEVLVKLENGDGPAGLYLAVESGEAVRVVLP